MESEKSALSLKWNAFQDWLLEQEWFQTLKVKWDALDSQSQLYAKVGGISLISLIALILLISSGWSARSLREEYLEKLSLISTLQSANDELKSLRDSNQGLAAASSGGPWPEYFESTAAQAGLAPGSVEVSPPTSSPAIPGESLQETLFELKLKQVSIKKVVKYAFQLETGSRPVKLRHLTIDTGGDPSGHMDAILSVSGFTHGK